MFNNDSLYNLRQIYIFWFPWHKIKSTWALYRFLFFFVVIDVSKCQRMRFVVYHNVQQEDFIQNNIWHHKGLVTYNKVHGTTTMSKHVFIKHFPMLNLYQSKRLVVDAIVLAHAQYFSKKRKIPTSHSIVKFFNSRILYKSSNLAQH